MSDEPRIDAPAQPDKPAGKNRKGIGGTFSHSPNCLCNPCRARRRQQEALAGGAGDGAALVPATPTEVKRAAPKPIRDRVAQYLHYRMVMPNATKTEIAEKMGITKDRLWQLLRLARESGFLKYEDPLERVENELIPKVVDNLNYFLDARDKTVTIEAAKGTIFKQFQAAHGISDAPSTVLALKIELPDGQNTKVVTGRIVGRPKEVIDAPLLPLDAPHEP